MIREKRYVRKERVSKSVNSKVKILELAKEYLPLIIGVGTFSLAVSTLLGYLFILGYYIPTNLNSEFGIFDYLSMQLPLNNLFSVTVTSIFFLYFIMWLISYFLASKSGHASFDIAFCFFATYITALVVGSFFLGVNVVSTTYGIRTILIFSASPITIFIIARILSIVTRFGNKSLFILIFSALILSFILIYVTYNENVFYYNVELTFTEILVTWAFISYSFILLGVFLVKRKRSRKKIKYHKNES